MKRVTIRCALLAMAFTSAAFADDTPVPTGNFLSSLKQSFSEDYEHEVVRGHFDIGPAPNSHRYYCLVNPNTGKTENNGIAGTPVRRRDGMTGIEGASVSFYSCSDAESKGLLVTNEYHVTIASAPHAPQVPALPVIQDRSPKSTTTDPMAVLRSFIDVFNGGDSAALASLLIDSTEFAWVQPDGSAVFGRQAAAEALQALHFSGSTLQLETENGRTISAASNTVILIIKLRLTQQSQDPRMIRCSGVMVETPKGWRIASLFMTPEATSRNARR